MTSQTTRAPKPPARSVRRGQHSKRAEAPPPRHPGGRELRPKRPKKPRAQPRSQARRERRAAEEHRARRERAGREESSHRTILSPLGVGIAIVAAVALFVGIAFVTGFLAPPGSNGALGSAGSSRTLVHSAASSVAFDSEGGWLADDQSGSIRRFDPASGSFVGRPIHTGGRPISIAAGYGRLWVADISNSVVYVLNPITGRTTGRPISVAQGPVSIATGEGGVWVASLLSGTVSLIDPRTEQVSASVALPDGAVRVAVGDGYAWVTGQTDTLARIDTRPLGPTLEWRETTVGQGPIGVAVGAGAVWVANAESGTVSKVDPRTVKVTATLRLPSDAGSTGSTGGQSPPGSGSDPETVAVWQNELWVGVGQQPVVLAFQVATGAEAGKPVTLPGPVRALTVSPSLQLWASTANPGTVDELTAG